MEFVREGSVVDSSDVGVEGVGGIDELQGFGDVRRHYTKRGPAVKA